MHKALTDSPGICPGAISFINQYINKYILSFQFAPADISFVAIGCVRAKSIGIFYRMYRLYE